MPIVQLIIVLVVIGVVLYLINTFIPMDSRIKVVINVIIVLALCVWLLQIFGVMSSLGTVQVPRVR